MLELPTIRFPDLPNTAQIGELTTKKAKQLSAYALHMYDLKFSLRMARQWKFYRESKDDDLADAAFLSCVSKLMSCFQTNKSRSSLNYKHIFKNEAKLLDAFSYYNNIRNKHLIHDENGFFQAKTVVLLDGNSIPLDVQALVHHQLPRPDAQFVELIETIEHVIGHIQSKMKELSEELLMSVELMPSYARMALPFPMFEIIGREEVGEDRLSKHSERPDVPCNNVLNHAKVLP